MLFKLNHGRINRLVLESDMAFVVMNKTGQHWLKGTVWTSCMGGDKFGTGATRYDTKEAAQAAIAKAAKFNPKGAKGAAIVEV
jgi:hypothetical protein